METAGYINDRSAGNASINNRAAPIRTCNTLGDVAEQTDALLAMSVDLIDRVRNLGDRIGAPYPPSSSESVAKEVPNNGPIDYAYNQNIVIQRLLGDVSNLVVAISSRI